MGAGDGGGGGGGGTTALSSSRPAYLPARSLEVSLELLAKHTLLLQRLLQLVEAGH